MPRLLPFQQSSSLYLNPLAPLNNFCPRVLHCFGSTSVFTVLAWCPRLLPTLLNESAVWLLAPRLHCSSSPPVYKGLGQSAGGSLSALST